MKITNKIDTAKLRQVAGAFATGITVVTTLDKNREVQGMTANSFLSVSLDPPLVLFSVQEGTAILENLPVGKAVGISILSDAQLDVSNQFAGLNKEAIEVAITEKSGASVINGALAWYSTKVQQVIPAGDHSLILCEVLDLDRAGEGEPILFYSGYRKIGDVVE